MKKDIALEDINLPLTDDPTKQREYVLRCAAIDVQRNAVAEKQIQIARDIGREVNRMQQRKKWPAHIVALALDSLTQVLCETIYAKGAEIEIQERGKLN
jgi:hypothetical protein